MTTLEQLKARETALLADRARIDEALVTVRAALSGAQAIIAEAQAAKAAAEEEA